MKIVTIGNCQAQLVGKYLLHLLGGKASCTFLPVTTHVGTIPDQHETETALSGADLIISTHLGPKHGYLSNEVVRSFSSKSAFLSFPYVYNTGFASIIYSPQNSVIFGKDPIVNLILNNELSPNAMKTLYRDGQIQFSVKKRFNDCNQILLEKERDCELHVSPYIHSCYQATRIFDTHNHPRKGLYQCLIQQIIQHDLLPALSGKTLYQDMLPPTGMRRIHHAITPQDIESHGYMFDADNGWISFGDKIIDLIYSQLPGRS